MRKAELGTWLGMVLKIEVAAESEEIKAFLEVVQVLVDACELTNF